MTRTTSRTMWIMPPRLTAAFRWAPVALSAFPALAMAAPTLAQEATPAAGQPCAAAIVDDAATRTYRLQADCVTDAPLFVTNGWTFDGGGHTISAMDPPGGRLQDAVLTVEGGAGDVRDVVIDGNGLTAPCELDSGDTALGGVLFRDSTGTAQWVTVRSIDRAFPPDAAIVEDGLGQRESCGTGIAVIGEAARATVTDSVLTDLGFAGVLVEEGAATVSDNVISRADDAGVLARSGAQVEVAAGNQIAYGFIGVRFEGEGTTGSISENAIAELERVGVVVTAGAQADLADNTFRDIGRQGVVVAEGGSAASARDTMERVGRGFVAEGGALRVEDVAITECIVGVVSENGSTVEVSRGTVRNCTAGIGVTGEGTHLTASETQVISTLTGVSVDRGGQATLAGLRIFGAMDGIVVILQSHAEVTEMQVEEILYAGLSAQSGSTVVLSNSSVKTVSQIGVFVQGHGSTLALDTVTISDATESGLRTQDGARAEVRNLQVDGGAAGVAAAGKGTLLLAEDLSITGSGTGVLVEEGATAEITRLVNAGSGTGALARSEGSRVTVRDSAITRPAQDGVRAEAGAWAQVEQTEIVDAGAAGIVVDWGTALPTRVNLEMTEAGCLPRVLTFAAGVPTTVRVFNAGSQPGQLTGGVLGSPLDVAPGERARVNVTPVPGDSTLQCVPPAGDGAWEEVILRAVPADQFPAAPRPTEAMILRGNTITGGVNGIVVEDAIPVTITGNSISGVSGEPLAVSDAAAADITGNTLGAAPPTP